MSSSLYFQWITAILLAFHSISFSGAAFYVAVDGSNSDDGTIGNPWATISKANNELNPGDTVFIREGTYSDGIDPARSGSSEQRIIYTNYAGETVIVSNVNRGIDLSSRSYITVNGIEFRSVCTFSVVEFSIFRLTPRFLFE